MTPLHIAALVCTAIVALVLGFVMGMCITAKRADDAMGRAMDKYVDEKIKSKDNL
jgi:hypothetical protein